MMGKIGLKYSKINPLFYITHPHDPSRKIYTFPDLVHILKNLTCGLRNHDVRISSKLISRFNLASTHAKFEDVIKVYDAQKSSPFKYAPKLTQIVIKPSQFEKMREQVAYDLIDEEVSIAIDVICQESSGKKNSTSFFIENLNKLQKIVNSKVGWSIDNPEKYNEDIATLTFLIQEFFPNIKFEIARGSFPSVTGAIISCSSLMALSRDMFSIGAPVFFPKHCTNNATENFFSQVTLKTPQPTALQFVQSMKGIIVSGFNFMTKNTYKFNDEEMQDRNIDYFKMAKEFNQPSSSESCHLEVIDLDFSSTPDTELFPTSFELLGFHKEIAQLINANMRILENCGHCKELMSLVPMDNVSSCLSPTAREFFSHLESCFRKLIQGMAMSDECFNDSFMCNSMKSLVFDHCFAIKEELVEKFLEIRSKSAFATRYIHLKNRFASKSLSK